MKTPIPLVKQAQQSRKMAYQLIFKVAAAMAGNEVKAPGSLRASASSAWRIGMVTPKPKTIRPSGRSGADAKEMPVTKPPSKTAFFQDLIKSLHSPARGFRLTKPGG